MLRLALSGRRSLSSFRTSPGGLAVASLPNASSPDGDDIVEECVSERVLVQKAEHTLYWFSALQSLLLQYEEPMRSEEALYVDLTALLVVEQLLVQRPGVLLTELLSCLLLQPETHDVAAAVQQCVCQYV